MHAISKSARPILLRCLVLPEFVELRGGFCVDSHDLDLLKQLFTALKELLSLQQLFTIAGLQQKLMSAPEHFDGCNHLKFTDLLDALDNASVACMGPGQRYRYREGTLTLRSFRPTTPRIGVVEHFLQIGIPFDRAELTQKPFLPACRDAEPALQRRF
jgi:hypothetical protein